MTLTAAIKGQITKAIKACRRESSANNPAANEYLAIRKVFARHMPAQQAKHAMRKYLAGKVGE